MSGVKDLRVERARFLMGNAGSLRDSKTAESLKDAPLRVRRMGLPLAVATWSREGNDKLIELLAKWLFKSWGAIAATGVPDSPVAFLNKIQDLDAIDPRNVSALEREAEELLQAAKLLSGAYTGRK